MTTGFNTSAEFASQVVKLFAAQALEPLQKTLKMGSIINRKWDNQPGAVGDTVNVAVPPTTVVANDISEGNAVQFQQTAISTVAITVNKHKESSFTIPDVSQLLTNVSLFDTYVRPHVIAMAEQIESDIFGLYTGLTTPAVGAQGTALTSAVIGSAETALYSAKAYGDKYLALTPADYDVVRALPEFSNVYQIGSDTMVSQALAMGVLGNIKGFNVFRSQLVPIATTHYNIAFTPDAMTLVSRPFGAIPPGIGAVSADIVSPGGFGMRLVWSYNAPYLAQQWTLHALYGVQVLRPTFGLQVKS